MAAGLSRFSSLFYVAAIGGKSPRLRLWSHASTCHHRVSTRDGRARARCWSPAAHGVYAWANWRLDRDCCRRVWRRSGCLTMTAAASSSTVASRPPRRRGTLFSFMQDPPSDAGQPLGDSLVRVGFGVRRCGTPRHSSQRTKPRCEGLAMTPQASSAVTPLDRSAFARLAVLMLGAGCHRAPKSTTRTALEVQGREIFRHDTFTPEQAGSIRARSLRSTGIRHRTRHTRVVGSVWWSRGGTRPIVACGGGRCRRADGGLEIVHEGGHA